MPFPTSQIWRLTPRGLDDGAALFRPWPDMHTVVASYGRYVYARFFNCANKPPTLGLFVCFTRTVRGLLRVLHLHQRTRLILLF